MGKLNLRFGALFVVGLALVACSAEGEEAVAEGSTTQSIPTSMLSERVTVTPPPMDLDLEDLGFDFGDDDAPIKIVEFSDYGCGFCRKFHTETLPILMSEYIETGMVQLKYVTYVSGQFPNGLPAAFAAECAGEQGVFYDMSQMLYERQGEWKREGDPGPIHEGFAEDLNLDLAEYRACVSEERPRARIRGGILTGARLGVRGTPSFLVDGYPLVGAQPLDVWRDIIQTRLEERNDG